MWSWDGLQLEVKKWATNGYYKETAICLEMLQVVFSLTWCSRNTEHLFMFRPSGQLCIFSPYTINRGHFRVNCKPQCKVIVRFRYSTYS